MAKDHTEEDLDQPQKIRRRRHTELSEVKSFQDLLKFYRIKPEDWDAILVTDGSGTTWEHSIGWAATLITKESFKRTVFSGSMSHGTVNTAEIMAVLHPLLWLTAHKQGVRTGGCKLHVMSDSKYVVDSLKHTDPIVISQTKANRELWVAVEIARRYGIVISSHFMHRDQIDLNRFAHDLANMCRRAQVKIVKNPPRDPYEANPEE